MPTKFQLITELYDQTVQSVTGSYAAMGYADGQEFDMRRRLEPSA